MSALSLPLSHCSLLLSSHSPRNLKLKPLCFHSRRQELKKKNANLSVRCYTKLITDIAPATAITYGTLLLGGGIFAYTRSGSKGSILGGLSGAALMTAAYYLMQSSETKQAGDALGFGSAFLFASVFGIRLAATRKFIPSGLLLLLSVGSLAVFFSAYLQDKIPQDIGSYTPPM